MNNFDNYDSVQFMISDSLFYEALLMVIRGETVRYCKQKARSHRRKENELQNNVQSMYDSLNSNKCSLNAQLLENAKDELEKHRKPYIDGLIVRSRTQWHEDGEKSSKYFLSLEKRNATRKSIQYIQYQDKIITKQQDILSIFTETFQERYSSSEDIELDMNFIKSNLTNTLSECEKVSLNKELTLQELTAALRNMKKGKTPGSYGFSVDFFRCFWKPLGMFLHRAFQLCYSQGIILPTYASRKHNNTYTKNRKTMSLTEGMTTHFPSQCRLHNYFNSYSKQIQRSNQPYPSPAQRGLMQPPLRFFWNIFLVTVRLSPFFL